MAMSLIVNTNVSSLIAQQNLSTSESSLQTAMQRLSSGLRVNSAADDAAGYAIANGMTSQINAFEQAEDDANDGVSLLQTASGALQQIDNNLQTIRQLTVQALSGTNSSTDDAYIQTEINQDLAQIDQVSAQTQFNGINLLGKNQTVNVQVGTGDGQVIPVGLQQVNTSSLGLAGFSVVSSTSTATEPLPLATPAELLSHAPGFSIANFGGTAVYTKQANGSYTAQYPNNWPLPPASDTPSTFSSFAALEPTIEADVASTTTDYGYDVTNAAGTELYSDIPTSPTGDAMSDSTYDNIYYDAATNTLTTDSADPVATAVDVADAMPVGDSFSITTAGGIDDIGGTYEAILSYPTSAPREQVFSSVSQVVSYLASNPIPVTGTAYVVDEGYPNYYLVTSGGTVMEDPMSGTPNPAPVYYNAAAATPAAMFTTTPGTETVTVGQAATKDPLAVLDAAISQVSNLAATLGAQQNRLTSALSDIETTATNLQAARSQIQDTDYAQEVSTLTQAQILQQAGASVLSKANQTPQAVLSQLQNA